MRFRCRSDHSPKVRPIPGGSVGGGLLRQPFSYLPKQSNRGKFRQIDERAVPRCEIWSSEPGSLEYSVTPGSYFVNIRQLAAHQ
ncbi:hypothetical protein FHU41_002496 [Psychromicrobium silvestre]|uniref:Uncharacterized protein n=1 Tax=Psychromicrobium silvestre TaxID=1645614 RepID=A0A7Y9S8R3_9MICC|nr:hypothetical protein [Psychromicrobium silvestre]